MRWYSSLNGEDYLYVGRPWSQIFNEEGEIMKRESSRRSRVEDREARTFLRNFILDLSFVFLSSTNDSSRPRSNLPYIHKHPKAKENLTSSMANDFESSSNKPPENSSCSGSGSNDAANFECNICFELAQDPIVTLCGHLFCWPCLYKWLHIHGQSQECPVCKAVIQEEKLVPLYGRGKTPTDPRSKSIPGMEIPHRPAGQRPETARPPDQNQFPHHGFGFMGGLAPMATARFGNLTFSTGFGGLFPSLLNFHVHGYPDATIYGSPAGIPYGFPNPLYGGHGHGFPHHPVQRQQRDILKVVFLALGIFVILALLWP